MDREKVIKGLNNISREIINTLGHGEAIPYLRTIDDAISLLKEQEVGLQNGRYYSDVFDIGYKAGKADAVVRCKNCKHRYNSIRCPVALIADILKDTKVFEYKSNDDWFCADGEVKE